MIHSLFGSCGGLLRVCPYSLRSKRFRAVSEKKGMSVHETTRQNTERGDNAQITDFGQTRHKC